MSSPSVLIIAPPGPVRDSLADDLRRTGCSVQTAPDGRAGLERATALQPDVVLLARKLATEDGLDICRRIEQSCEQPPVFVITPQATADGGMEIDLDRLALGVRTLLGWGRVAQESTEIEYNGLRIDYARHRAVMGARKLNLTPTEFQLLWMLARRPGRVYSRQQLTEVCRGENAQVQARTIDVHIRSIRQKLGSHASLIETVHGVGYRFREAEG